MAVRKKQKLETVTDVEVTMTETVEFKRTYTAIENVRGDVNGNRIDAKKGEVLKLTEFEAKVLERFIKE